MFRPASLSIVFLFLTISSISPAFAEADATLHEVFLAAEAGKFTEAQTMMDKVLRDHPNSAKAHFVEAELLAKQGLLSNAAAELNNAERIQPGLPFVKPEVLQNLQHLINSGSQQSIAVGQSPPFGARDWMPSVLWILGIGLVIVLLMKLISRRNGQMIPANNYAGNGVNSVMGQPPSSGSGSGLMGSLATGAALGAGVAAGEALVNHFINHENHSGAPFQDAYSDVSPSNLVDDDMGGADFGIDDASSWDDNGGMDGGGDDWT